MYPMPVSVSTGSYLKKEIPNLGKSRFLNPTTEQVYDTMDQDDSSNLPNRTASSFITPTTDHSTPLYATVDQVESNNLSNNEPQFKNTNIRHAFIRKVFGLVATQMVLTIAIMCLIKFVSPVNLFLLRNSWIIWITMSVTFMFMFVLACIEKVLRTYPLNLFLLFVFTVMESTLVGFISLSYKTETIFISACITCAIVFALILFSFQTKYDFTGKSVYLFILGICLVSFGFISIFFQSSIMLIVYSVLGAAFFSIYLIFDVQLMLAGKHKYAISPEDYVMASLNLYVDIINLFLMILNLVRATED
jgi:protein lifeguard